MAGCAAVNCSSSTRRNRGKRRNAAKKNEAKDAENKQKVPETVKLYRFPSDPIRRHVWANNMRRDKWAPNDSSRLCEKHFERSQFIKMTKKLKRDAIPTLFNLQPPKETKAIRKKIVKPITDDDPAIVISVDISEFEPPRIVLDPIVMERHVVLDHAYSTKKTPKVLEEKTSNDNATKHVCEPVSSDAEKTACLKCKILSLENEEMKKKLQTLEKQILGFQKNIKMFLKPDQISSLSYKSRGRRFPWTGETLTEALKIRCAVGSHGYEYLRSVNYPLPRESLLYQNNIAKSQFAPGILGEIIEWMGRATQTLTDQDRLCSLKLDEIQISQADIEVNTSSTAIPEYVSQELRQPHHLADTVASHALCFMVEGIVSKWKQIVAYYFTGESVGGLQLWNITRQLITLLGQNQFKVVAVVSDMSANNQEMWEAAGIFSNRFEVACEISHPFYNEEKLNFIADVPHLMKDLGYDFSKQNVIIPEFALDEYQLESEKARLSDIRSLTKFQDEKQVKIAPLLTKSHVKPTVFRKMSVEEAENLLSHATASGIRSMVDSNHLQAHALSTAFFCQHFSHWFNIMNAKHIKEAMFTNSSDNTTFLRGVIYFTANMKFLKDEWKPVQSGIILSTSSILSLHQRLCVQGSLEFLLPGRFSRNALDKLINQVRVRCQKMRKVRKDDHLKVTEFKDALKLISVAQFMKPCPNWSCHEDDTPDLVVFIRKRVTWRERGKTTSNSAAQASSRDASVGVQISEIPSKEQGEGRDPP